MNRYIDPTADIFIIYLLGSPENNLILLDFINSVLSDSGFERIVDVEVKNPFNIKTFSYDKMSILDV
nr:PD-(D/E)XK nuclease family transposase [Spirochaetota bacterium]